MKSANKKQHFKQIFAAMLAIVVCSVSVFAKYDPNKDYSKELARNDLSTSERKQLEAERQEKINDKYGGKEPPMYGTSEKFSDHYSSSSSGASSNSGSENRYDGSVNITDLTTMQQNAIETIHQAQKEGKVSVAEANEAIQAIQQSGASGNSVSQNSSAVDTLLKSMGAGNNEQNRQEATVVMNGGYTSSKINGVDVHSALVDSNGNALYYEAGKVYKEDANGNWVVDTSYPTSSGALDLDQETINAIIEQKIAYAQASTAQEKQAIHDKAEEIRHEAGYSGGLDGSFYTPTNSSSGGSGSSGGSSVLKSFSITASAGAHGTVSPSGTAVVLEGSTHTYVVTPNSGYTIASVTVDGRDMGIHGRDTYAYTFFDVNGNHTITVTFKSKLKLDVGGVTITGIEDVVPGSHGTLKSGYGFGIVIPFTVENGNVSATAQMSNGDSCGVMEQESKLIFVRNPSSPTQAHVYYVPVATPNGPFTCTVTITATNKDDPSDTIMQTVTKTISINGTMYEDDFTGDRL